MSWKADKNGKITNLDRSNQPEARVSENDAGDSSFLAKYLTRFGQLVAQISKQWSPDFAEFEVVSTGVSATPFKATLPHNFKSPVVWWITRVVGATATSPGTVVELATSTDSILYLNFYWSGTFNVRVEKSQ